MHFKPHVNIALAALCTAMVLAVATSAIAAEPAFINTEINDVEQHQNAAYVDNDLMENLDVEACACDHEVKINTGNKDKPAAIDKSEHLFGPDGGNPAAIITCDLPLAVIDTDDPQTALLTTYGPRLAITYGVIDESNGRSGPLDIGEEANQYRDVPARC